MLPGKGFGIIQQPQVGNLVVGHHGDLMHLHPLAVAILMVHGLLDIGLQLLLPAFEFGDQQVIDTFCTSRVFLHISKPDLHADPQVDQGAHVLLIVLDRIKERPGPLVHPVPVFYFWGDVIPVAVQHEHHMAGFAPLHDQLKLRWQRMGSGTDVLDPHDAHRWHPMLAGLFGFLLTLLQVQHLNGGHRAVFMPDLFRDIEVGPAAIGGFIFHGFPLLVLVDLRVLPAHTHQVGHLLLPLLAVHHRVAMQVIVVN